MTAYCLYGRIWPNEILQAGRLTYKSPVIPRSRYDNTLAIVQLYGPIVVQAELLKQVSKPVPGEKRNQEVVGSLSPGDWHPDADHVPPVVRQPKHIKYPLFAVMQHVKLDVINRRRNVKG